MTAAAELAELHLDDDAPVNNNNNNTAAPNNLTDNPLHHDDEASNHVPPAAASSPGRSAGGGPQPEADDDDKEESSEQAVMVPFLELFRYATSSSEKLMIATAFFFAAVAGLAMPAFALVFGDLLNSFNQSDDEDDMIDKVSEQAYRFVIIGVISLIAGTVGLGLFMWSSEVRTKRLREEFLQAVLAKDVGWFDSHKPREVAAQMAVDSLEYHNGTGEKIFTGTMHACTFVAGLVIGFVRGWELTLLVLGCTPLMMISLGIFMNVVSVWGKKVAEAYARAGAIADETVASLRTVQAYSGEKRELKRYEAELGLAKEVGQKRYLAEGLALGCTDAVIFSSYGLCLWFGAWLIREDRGYDGGDVISVFFAVLIGAMSIAQVGPALQSIAAARSAAARMFAVIDEPPAFQTQWTRGEGKEIEDMRGALELRDVEFSYPTRPDEVVLRGVSLRIEPGQVVALVGESGSGKSTTCALLQRFYDPLAGQVLVDGVPLQELNLRFWRDSVAFVSQDAVVFTGTVRENIAMGKEGATDEEIIAAAKAAHVHEFVKKLPKGYDTHVGEDGSSLSGGQKQRVAIARAIVRDPKVLLLDEATSALSETDQALVQEALNRLMENRTTLVIAHRLSTVRSADLICVLEHGEIVERGTHEDLMAKKGHYHRLQVHGQMAHAEQKNIESMLTLGADDAADDDEARATSGDHDRDASSRRQSTADAFGIRNSAEMAAVGEDGDEDPVDLDKAGVWADAPDVPTMRVVKMTVKLSPLYVALGFVGGAAIGVIWPLWAVLFADMTELLYYEDEEKQEDESRLVALLFFALGVGICVARVLNIGGFGRVGEVLTEKLRSDTFDALVHQEQGFFDRPENNKKVLLARLHQDTNAVHGGATQRVGLGVRIAVTIVTALVIAFVKAWQLAFVVILVMPMIAIGSSFQMKMLTGYTKEAGKSFEQAGRISGQALDSIRVVAAYCLERRTLDTFSAALAAPLETAKRAAFGAGFGFGCAQFVIFATYGLNFYVGGLLVKEGEISYNGMFSAIFAIVMAGVGIGQATEFAPDAVAAVRARNNIFFLLDRASPIDARDTSCSEAKLNGEGTVELDNVSFAYPTRPDTNVLERCSLRVERGQTLALVGPSGHGKSTVVSLLMRFYDVLDGAVRVDGKDVREVDVSVLRQQIGLVSQNPDLFDASVRENILYGAPEGTTEEDMVEAAKQANIHDTIVDFHDGYDTPVGPKGGKLSGGQRQRVALARALVRKPSILVLDEATSALDAQSQEVVRQALLALMEAKLCTTIVIAHRLSTVQRCDQIAVIANGGVAELGTHEELVQQGGLYAGLVHAGEQSAE